MGKFRTDIGMKLLKEMEGCSFVAYQDLGGKWTIGYGSTRGVNPGMTVTLQDADERLWRDVEEISKDVSAAVPSDLNDNQFTAFCLFAFNMANWASSEQLIRIKEMQLKEAAQHWLLYDHFTNEAGVKIESEGLLNRRKTELALFQTPG